MAYLPYIPQTGWLTGDRVPTGGSRQEQDTQLRIVIL